MSIISETTSKCQGCLEKDTMNGIYCISCFTVLIDTPLEILREAGKLYNSGYVPIYGTGVWNQIMLEQNHFTILPKNPFQEYEEESSAFLTFLELITTINHQQNYRI